jgi:hypothetical protein
VYLFVVFMFSPNILTSSAQTRSWCVPASSNPSRFSWTFLNDYSKYHKLTGI